MYNKKSHLAGDNSDLHDDFENIKLKARETRDAFSQAAHDVKQRANDILHQSLKDAKEKSTDLQENVVTYVKANPVKAVGIAVLAGIIVAKLLHK